MSPAAPTFGNSFAKCSRARQAPPARAEARATPSRPPTCRGLRFCSKSRYGGPPSHSCLVPEGRRKAELTDPETRARVGADTERTAQIATAPCPAWARRWHRPRGTCATMPQSSRPRPGPRSRRRLPGRRAAGSSPGVRRAATSSRRCAKSAQCAAPGALRPPAGIDGPAAEITAHSPPDRRLGRQVAARASSLWSLAKCS